MAAVIDRRAANLEPAQLDRGLRAHREDIRRWGATTPNVEWLEVDYPASVRDPAPTISRLVEFLGRERLPNEHAMAAVIDPWLQRRK